MKLIGKRILASLLSVVMLLAVVPVMGLGITASAGAYGPETYTDGIFEYYLSDDEEPTAIIAKCYAKELESVIIPSEIDGYVVTGLGLSQYYFGSVFEDCVKLSEIVLPDTIVEIGPNTFNSTAYYNDESNWENGLLYIGHFLVAVKKEGYSSYTIKEGTKIMPNGAFVGCSELEHIVLPQTLLSIPSEAFYGCTNLTSVMIPESVTNIGLCAFCSCESLTNVTIGDGVTKIGYSAFDNTGIYNDSASWENNVLYIGKYLIKAKQELSSAYTIKEGTRVIADNAFSSCDSLTNITIPDSVITIGTEAFWTCESLTSVTIGNSVTAIGNAAFASCGSLVRITIGESVTTIGDYAFDDCGLLECIDVSADNDAYSSLDGVLFNKDKTILILYPINKADASYKIPSGVTKISDESFKGCNFITSVTIPDSVITIGDEAFNNCESLTSVTIGDGVITIGEGAFMWCDSLVSLEIPDSVKTIGDNLFYCCQSLKSVTIGESVEKIEHYTFDGCNSLERIDVSANNGAYSSLDGVLFNKDKTILIFYPDRKATTSYTVPDSVTTIGDDAFRGCEFLASVTIGKSVETIGDYAFSDCYSLENIENLDSVKTIGISAFSWCSALTSVVIPDSVTTIESFAFSCCDSLTSVTIPDSVTTIGYGAFHLCYSLTSITIGDGVTTIDDSAFEGCHSISNIYYNGTKAEWDEISVGEDNEKLLNATIRFLGGDGHTHSYTITVNKEATCEESGNITYTCLCGDAYTEDVSAKGHSYTPSVTKEATCEESGAIAYTCSCGDMYTKYIAPKGHSYTSSVTTQPTQTTDGVKTYTCHCGYAYTESIPAYDKTLISINLVQEDDEKAVVEVKLQRGSFTGLDFRVDYSKTKISCCSKALGCMKIAMLSAMGNAAAQSVEASSVMFSAAVEKGFDSEGAVLATFTFDKINGAEISKEDFTLVVTNCSSKFAVVNNIPENEPEFCEHEIKHMVVPSTCVDTGEEYDVCVICGEITNRVDLPLSDCKIRHMVIESTCKVQGMEYDVCLICGKSSNNKVLPLADHNTTHIKVDSTCIQEGYEYDLCSVCEKQINYVEIPLSEHKNKHMVIESTCKVQGMEYDVCLVCGTSSNNKVLPLADHNTTHIKVDSTCIQEGYEYDLCSVCGKQLNYVELSLAKHQNKHIVIKSTCKVQGKEYDECLVCGTVSNEKKLSLVPHTWSEWVVTKAPTTESEGIETRDCSVCGEQENRSVPKLIVIKDESTGIEIEYSDEYDSKVEIEVEEIFDGDSFHIIDANFENNQSVVFDINTLKDGIKIQPSGGVKVRIPLPKGFSGDGIVVCHVDTETNKITDIPAIVIDGYVEFFAEHFSYYAIVEELGQVNSVSVDDISMNYKASKTVTPDISADAGVKYTVTYSSSDTDVVSVDSNGRVITNGTGSATITVTVTDEYGNTVTDTCEVNVSYQWWQWIIVIVLFGWIWY